VLEEWADLPSRAVERNPYVEPAFALPAVGTSAPGRVLRSDDHLS